MAGGSNAIARVQWWNERRFTASCPYCDKTHRHGFGGDQSEQIKYSGIRRQADCRGGDYVVVFPFDPATNRAGYEIDKQERQFVSAYALDGQASAVDTEAGRRPDGDEPATSTLATRIERPRFVGTPALFVLSMCLRGNVQYVETFIESRGMDDEERRVFLHGEFESGDTTLYLAATERNSEMVRLLLGHGCDVNAQNHQGRTPLMGAALWGRPDNVRVLLEHQADTTLRDVDGKLAIDFAQYSEENDLERYRQGGEPETMMYAARRTDWKQIVVLLDEQATPDQLFGFNAPDAQRPRYALQPDASFALVTPIASAAGTEEGAWAQVALLERGGQFPIVFATSRDVSGTVETAVGGQSLAQLVAKIATLVDFALPQGSSGQPSASHAEMQLIAYFIDKHVFLPDEFVAKEMLQEVLWRQQYYEYADAEEDPEEMRAIALTQLKLAQPPVWLTQAIIKATTAACRHCEEFCRRVNDHFGLELTLEYRRKGDPSGAPVVVSTDNLAARCGAMHEAEDLSRGVLSRLAGHLGNRTVVVQPRRYASTATEQGPVEAITARFYLLLEQHGSKPVLWRLVSARSLVGALRCLHGEIDLLDGENNNPHPWEAQWEADVVSMKQQLASNAEQNARISELSDSEAQEEVMTLLIHEFTTRKGDYSENELGLLKQVLSDIVGLTKARVPEVEEWFIPHHEVESGKMIGHGSFATVHKGVWRKAEVVKKCVKVQSEDDKRTFLREVRIWWKARHCNIVQFFGACHVGEFFIVCEYAEGGTITNYLSKQRKAGKSVAWRKLLQVARALYYLHEQRIVHGDLKGDNILVSKDGDAKLSDFGLSFDQSGSRARPEKLGAIRWRAPEVVLAIGDDVRSKAADVYSLGMCIVHAVTGHLPWGDLSDDTVRFHLKNRKFMPKPDEMTDSEWEVVKRMCVFEPSERMPLADVIEQLETFAANEEIADRRSQKEITSVGAGGVHK